MERRIDPHIPGVSVVIPNYNGRPWLQGLFASLAEQSGIDCEVLVVDNGSTDGSHEVIPEGIHYLPLGRNHGFARAVNIGIEASHHPFVFVVNNDVVLEREALTRLVRFLGAHPEYDFVQPKMRFLHDPERINNVGDTWNIFGKAVQLGFGEIDRGQYDTIHEIFSPTAGAALYRRSVFERIGGFDERFFAYIEDLDLGFRMRLVGMRGVLLPEAVVYHGFQSTTRRFGDFARFHVMRNIQYTLIKNLPCGLMIRHLPQLLIGHIRNGVVCLKDGKISLLYRVYADVIRSLPDLLVARREIQRQRRVSLKTLDRWFLKRFPFMDGRPS